MTRAAPVQGKRRVCVFCETWESGGIESFLNNVLLRMDFSRIEIDIVAVRLRGSVFSEQLQSRGVRFEALSGSKYRIFENGRRFRRLLAERRYDVLHLNMFHALPLYYAHLARRAGVTARIAHSHCAGLRRSGTQWMKLGLHRVFRRLFIRDATGLWACSEPAWTFMFGAGRGMPRRIVPDGIDPERFRFRADERENVRRRLGLEGRTVIGNVGRLCEEKNQAFLIEAFAEVLKRRKDSTLLLVGDGPERERLENRARALGISEQVIFYGLSSRVEHLLWAMDVFAFPSRIEGLGMAVVEAQAAGLPAVCSEAVPDEARIGPRAVRVPLRGGPSVWAEALLAAERGGRCAEAAETLRLAGYDVRDVSGLVEDEYMRVRSYDRDA